MEQNLDKKKIISLVVSALVVIVLLIVVFATDVPALILHNKEYKAYKYAKEKVIEQLSFPSTAKLPSFNESMVKKSSSYANIIIDSSKLGRTYENAWDVSGYGTTQNKLGMTVNFKFNVIVVEDKAGNLWCYECNVE